MCRTRIRDGLVEARVADEDIEGRMLGGSLSLREIGQQLHVSPNTVKTHTKAIYRKLGVSTRLDAIAKGHDAGIL